jgi:hypothetical protein
MKTWQIWSEGYSVTGQAAEAHMHGAVEAETFEDACRAIAKRDGEFAQYFDLQKMTFWGCRLFDNEADARKSFG